MAETSLQMNENVKEYTLFNFKNVCAHSSVVSDSLQPHNYSPPGYSVLGISQATILMHWQVDSLPLAPPKFQHNIP